MYEMKEREKQQVSSRKKVMLTRSLARFSVRYDESAGSLR
jgi:hypothetical protein